MTISIRDWYFHYADLCLGFQFSNLNIIAIKCITKVNINDNMNFFFYYIRNKKEQVCRIFV